MTPEYALDRLIEKLEIRFKRWEDRPDRDAWDNGVYSATKWALEDAKALKSLITEKTTV